MNKAAFPVIALFIGIFIHVVLVMAISAESEPLIPLLTMLLMAEFGVILTAIGSFMGGKLILTTGFNLKTGLATLGCMVVAIMLGIEGVGLWDYINNID